MAAVFELALFMLCLVALSACMRHYKSTTKSNCMGLHRYTNGLLSSWSSTFMLLLLKVFGCGLRLFCFSGLLSCPGVPAVCVNYS